jgi:hypothetical protein
LELGPLLDNVIEMIEDNLSNLTSFLRAEIERIRLNNIIIVGVNPVFAFGFGLPGMYVDGLASFVRIEEQTPAEDFKNCRHWGSFLIFRTSLVNDAFTFSVLSTIGGRQTSTKGEMSADGIGGASFTVRSSRCAA